MSFRRISPVTLLVLWLFWVVLVGRLDWTSLVVGLGVAILLALIDRDLVLTRDEGGRMSPGLVVGWVWYLARLLVMIVRANIQIALIVLSPRLPIAPVTATFSTRLTTDLGKMALGNSITLTPGTLTVGIDRDRFLIHALTRDCADALRSRTLEGRILKLERGGAGD